MPDATAPLHFFSVTETHDAPIRMNVVSTRASDGLGRKTALSESRASKWTVCRHPKLVPVGGSLVVGFKQ